MANAQIDSLFGDIADAIREVNGTQDQIPALEFPNLIRKMTYTPPSIPRTQEEFNLCSWDELVYHSSQCSKNGIQEYNHLLGFYKDISVYDGTSSPSMTSIKGKLIGLNHDDLVSGGKAGFTFQLTDGLSFHLGMAGFQMNESNYKTGGWESSYMRKWMLDSLERTLPYDLRDNIKPVKKKSSTGNAGTKVVETEDTLFLLSLIESIGSTKIVYKYNDVSTDNHLGFEGYQYEYYKQFDNEETDESGLNTAYSAHLIKDNTGSYYKWWTRSLTKTTGSQNFYYMRDDGGFNDDYSTMSYLPAAAFCI